MTDSLFDRRLKRAGLGLISLPAARHPLLLHDNISDLLGSSPRVLGEPILSTVAVVLVGVVVDVTEDPRHVFGHVCVDAWQARMCTENAP